MTDYIFNIPSSYIPFGEGFVKKIKQKLNIDLQGKYHYDRQTHSYIVRQKAISLTQNEIHSIQTIVNDFNSTADDTLTENEILMKLFQITPKIDIIERLNLKIKFKDYYIELVRQQTDLKNKLT